MRVRDGYAKDKGAWCALNRPDIEEKEADIVIFGIPFDEGVSYRSGANMGPSTLRENTFSSTPYTEDFESLTELKVHDGGDFKGTRDEIFPEVEEYTEMLVREGKFFTMVGGDHSVTIPVHKGIDDALDEEFGIIHIDAHFDLCDELGGDELSHGSTERRAIELDNVGSTDNLYFIGIRSIEPDEYQFKSKNKVNVFNAKACHEKDPEEIAGKVAEHMERFDKVYITLDIDCLEVGFAPGTGTPQFGGLYPRQVLRILEILFERLDVIGFDVVEVAPPLDAPAHTAMFAARKIITEVWGFYGKKTGKVKRADGSI